MEKDDSYEPTHFVWRYDGLPVVGTLADWAKMWDADHYSGDCPPPTRVYTLDDEKDPQPHTVHVGPGRRSENDYILHTITVPGLPDTVTVCIDGRA